MVTTTTGRPAESATAMAFAWSGWATPCAGSLRAAYPPIQRPSAGVMSTVASPTRQGAAFVTAGKAVPAARVSRNSRRSRFMTDRANHTAAAGPNVLTPGE